MKKLRKSIEIPEIARVEGHSAVNVDIVDGKVEKVQLEVFEGTRFFEKIVLGHPFSQIPHITSRVCAICSTGHVLAAIIAIEKTIQCPVSHTVQLLRELMHLGMIIESHATHIYALALPDFIGCETIFELASNHPQEFANWNRLRDTGAKIQTLIGGRPFHPVNLQVGGFSSFPKASALANLSPILQESKKISRELCQLLLGFPPKFSRTTTPAFLSLIPPANRYSFFGNRIRCSEGWEADIDSYKEYLAEKSVPYSHAKRSTARGKPLMVGAMARLNLFSSLLSAEAQDVYKETPLALGDTNTVWNNLAQAIEILESSIRAAEIIDELCETKDSWQNSSSLSPTTAKAGSATGAVECPRGTLYHFYELDQAGKISFADMITPSAQNSARIEVDIREVVESADDVQADELSDNLETLVRAYDPCNTCATHMVSIRRTSKNE